MPFLQAYSFIFKLSPSSDATEAVATPSQALMSQPFFPDSLQCFAELLEAP